MNRKWLKLWSLALCLALVLQLLPVQALAAGNETPEGLADVGNGSLSRQQALEGATIVEEVVSGRSEYAKEYRLSNGLHMAAVSPEALHYQLGGQWLEIDNTLKPLSLARNSGYTNTAGPWQAIATRLRIIFSRP